VASAGWLPWRMLQAASAGWLPRAQAALLRHSASAKRSALVTLRIS